MSVIQTPLRLDLVKELFAPSLLSVLTLALAGCGGGEQPPAPQQQAQAAQQPTQVASVPAAPPTNDSGADDVAESGSEEETKWLGKVPYDVFYDRPLTLVGSAPELGAQVVAPVSVATTQTPSTTMTPGGASTTASSEAATPNGAGVQWSALIAPEVLDAESKVIRSRLTSNLQSVSTYNRSIDAITTDAIIFAALGGVAEQYDTDMRWKERAGLVRTLAYTMYENVGDRGRSAFSNTETPFFQLTTVLDGGKVDDVEVEEGLAFSDYAFRGSLMERINSSFDWMRSNIASEANLKDAQEDVVREASVLAMLGGMIQDDSYEFTEEKDYMKYCGDFTTACQNTAAAAEQLDFAAFQDAISRIKTSCDECHGKYAFADEDL